MFNPYFVNPPMYGLSNMYNSYRAYPSPYYFNPPIFNPYLPNQFVNEFNYDLRGDFFQFEDQEESIELKDYGPNPFVININEATKQNDNFRTALWTGEHFQITLMSIPVGGEIGLENHSTLDQFLRIEEGQGLVKMGKSENNLDFQQEVYDDFAFVIPAGTWHNLVNTGYKPIKLYSIYAPPNHPKDTVHTTKAEAEAAEESRFNY